MSDEPASAALAGSWPSDSLFFFSSDSSSGEDNYRLQLVFDLQGVDSALITSQL